MPQKCTETIPKMTRLNVLQSISGSNDLQPKNVKMITKKQIDPNSSQWQPNIFLDRITESFINKYKTNKPQKPLKRQNPTISPIIFDKESCIIHEMSPGVASRIFERVILGQSNAFK